MAPHRNQGFWETRVPNTSKLIRQGFQARHPWLWNVARALAGSAQELLGLAVPLHCAGCGAPDVVLCTRCQAALYPQLRKVPDLDFSVLACGAYEGTLRSLLVEWKDHGRGDLSVWIQAASRIAGAQCARGSDWSESCSQSVLVVLVPMPSSRAATVRRQFVPAKLVAQGLAQGLRDCLPHIHSDCPHRVEVSVVDALRMARERKDQVGLGRVDRRRNALGSLRVSEKHASQVGRASLIVIVDDIVTTGSSMNEAKRNMSEVTGTNVRGFALVHTPRS